MMDNEKFYAVTDTPDERYGDAARHDDGRAYRNVHEYARTNDVRWTTSWMVEFVERVMTNPTVDGSLFNVHQAYLFINTAIEIRGWDKQAVYASLTRDQDYYEGVDGKVMTSTMREVWDELLWVNNGLERVKAHEDAIRAALAAYNGYGTFLANDLITHLARATMQAEHEIRASDRRDASA